MVQATVRAPGSCGELVQGMIGERDFLITCPINCYSEVTVDLDPEELQHNINHHKAILAVHKTLQFFKQPQRDFSLCVSSSLPIGKGMASSSADVSAAILATAACLGQTIAHEHIAQIALAIEPTDAVFFPGVMLFDHRFGKVCEALGQPPKMEILIFDCGGHIDTLLFNTRGDLKEKNQQKEKVIQEAVSLIKEGIAHNDVIKIGRAATLSALANQRILPKPNLEEILHSALRSGAVGINVAHSGTVLGILLDPQALLSKAALIKEISVAFPDLAFLQHAELIGGGLEINGVRRGGDGINR